MKTEFKFTWIPRIPRFPCPEGELSVKAGFARRRPRSKLPQIKFATPVVLCRDQSERLDTLLLARPDHIQVGS